MRAEILCVSVALLASAIVQAALQTSSSSSSSSSTTISLIRLKASKLRRPESCRENLPRKSEDLPVLVITGRVREVYPASGADQVSSNSGANNNKALVSVGRVIRGNQQLVGSDIIVSGFNGTSSTPCPNYVKPNDTYIMLLNHENDRKYSIQGSNLLSMNLNNLDRVNAIAADEAYKRRAPIEDILCEAHYCAYGRCNVTERGLPTCQCPSNCPPLPSPVCGSDNTTYTNECHLILEGCRRQRPLFAVKEAVC